MPIGQSFLTKVKLFWSILEGIFLKWPILGKMDHDLSNFISNWRDLVGVSPGI